MKDHLIHFEAATAKTTLEAIEQLAEKIWHHHYTPIIGQEQVLYMLDKFQSVKAMQQQISQDGYLYFSINQQEQLIGYLACQPTNDTLFLSKFYLHQNQRGKGYARLALNFIESIAQKHRCHKIRLYYRKYRSAK